MRGRPPHPPPALPAAIPAVKIPARITPEWSEAVPELIDVLSEVLEGRYRLEHELGRGGYGVVYLAQDLRHARRVAIKATDLTSVSHESSVRFHREIEVAARLQHPNLMPLFESGQDARVLWYAMPYFPGETLAARLERHGPIELDTAVRLTREACDALQHLHDAGIVHRDVKPSNLMLSGGHIVLADYGVALLQAAPGVTLDGIRVGTPEYMAPEQAAAGAEIDGRSDVYGLGCVLYEMLAGSPPFTANTPRAVFLRHALDPVPPVRTVRPTVPPAVAEVLHRALEKTPADRWPSAQAFSDALGQALGQLTQATQDVPAVSAPTPAVSRPPARTTRWAIAAGALAIAVIAIAARRASTEAEKSRMATLRDDIWLITADDDAARSLIRRELAARNGLTVIEAPAGTRDVRRAALAAGAAHWLEASLRRDADGERLLVQAVSVRDNRVQAAGGDAPLPSVGPARDSAVEELVDAARLPDVSPALRRESSIATRHDGARRAWLDGMAALDAWHLDAADSAFALAKQLDPSASSPAFRLAAVRWFAGKRTSAWRYLLADAGRSAPVSLTEVAIVEALDAWAVDDRPAACARWRAETRRDPAGFEAWHGLALCLERDNVVVPDRRSPSGYAFRTSWHEALGARIAAFDRRPAVLQSLAADGFESVRTLFKTGSNDVRSGRLVTDAAQRFLAMPSSQGDTLALVPYPDAWFAQPTTARLARVGRSDAALRRQRELFRDVATTWMSAQPSSASAHEAMGVALFYLGSQRALDTLQSAPALARDDDERRRVLGTLAWVRIMLGAPDNPRLLESGIALADSLVRTHTPAARGESRAIAALAALIGRTSTAIVAARAERNGAPGDLDDLTTTLEIHAAMTSSPDTLAAVERAIEGVIRSAPGSDAGAMRLQAYARGVPLAGPTTRLVAWRSAPTDDDYMLFALNAAGRADWEAARRKLATVREVREAIGGATSPDAVAAETALLLAGGDTATALRELDAYLLRERRGATVMRATPAAAFVRCAALRATVAAALGDTATALRWGRAVDALWGDGEPGPRRLARSVATASLIRRADEGAVTTPP